jgi:hypothetical protein
VHVVNTFTALEFNMDLFLPFLLMLSPPGFTPYDHHHNPQFIIAVIIVVVAAATAEIIIIIITITAVMT